MSFRLSALVLHCILSASLAWTSEVGWWASEPFASVSSSQPLASGSWGWFSGSAYVEAGAHVAHLTLILALAFMEHMMMGKGPASSVPAVACQVAAVLPCPTGK